MNLSKGKNQIISCHTILYDGASYDSYFEFMLMRVFKAFICINKDAWFLIITYSNCQDDSRSSCGKELCENFTRIFVPQVFNNNLEVRSQIDLTLPCEFRTDSTSLAI